ncbi:SnoaL-like protein [Actinocorallia herbida]|uniref:SnoaL-like protein n=1 Tax=Actinocorallia herbida TaxID=58109 RepID=A0A3N1D3V1_9ACTN|nr:SnoaL-like protein [Actinocorallia herbida]
MDATTARLAAVEEIQRLKYRYLRTLDLKLWDEFADTLAPDATADYGSHVGEGPLRFSGRDAIVAYMSGALAPGITTRVSVWSGFLLLRAAPGRVPVLPALHRLSPPARRPGRC